MSNFLNREQEEIYTERVRAGKRTYFFDVKKTRSDDYYLTITENKRIYKEEGYSTEKHKIFLYKEDFKKFSAALDKSVNYIKEELLPEVDFDKFDREEYYKNTKKSMGESTDTGEETELKWD